ncbi:MAG: ABC transporter substrate-binding protein [Pseudomonadota bacterium]
MIRLISSLFFAGLGAVVLFVSTTSAARAEIIAVSIPLSGDYAELGQNFRTGVKLAMEKIGSDHELFIADDGCDPDLGSLAADDIKSIQPSIVIGLLCNDTAIAVAGNLVDEQIPVLVSGAQSIRLIKDRYREAWNLWRLSPGDDYPIALAAKEIAKSWKTTPYAIVDDGTIYGRNFTDALRLQMEALGLPPQFSDNFRAAQSTQAGLLRRLERSGVTAVFIAAATTEDLFTIASNIREFEINLDIITTEALQVLPFLESSKEVPEGIQVLMSPVPFDAKLDTILKERDIEPSKQLYFGYAAVQIALQTISNSPSEMPSVFTSETFETVLGQIEFSDDGSSSYNPYVLRTWNGIELLDKNNAVESQ